MVGFHGERREVARYSGEKRNVCVRDGAPARRPLAAKGKVVERERLQIGPSIARPRQAHL
jgi:hypothetical protein